MYKASIGLLFRYKIPFLVLTVLCVLYFYMYDSNHLKSTKGQISSNPGNATTPERYKTHTSYSDSGLKSSKNDSKEEEETIAIGSKRDRDQKLKTNVKNEKTNTQNSPYVDKKLNWNMTEDIKNKTILLWNPSIYFKLFSNFNMDLCAYKNCRVTLKRRIFETTDAVVYFLFDDGMEQIPPVKPHMRSPNQVWIFFTLEPPVNLNLVKRPYMNPEWQNVFNWSWTYRTDSDIFHPYGTLITKEIVAERNYSEIFRKKSKIAAWAVTHCRTSSKREKYVELLKQYVNVDIYGRCGVKGPPDLSNIFNNNYKFYLGFEHSLCHDYVTEKFFDYYKLDVINIVRGQGDYNRYLPKGSFINTADFPSVKSLAKFMLELGSNEEEYIKYLKRKDKFQVYDEDFTYRDALCSVCEKLNNLEMHKNTYPNVSDWLGSCLPATDLK